MKSLITVLAFLASVMTTKQNDNISIKYIGKLDKPIQTLIISKKNIERENCTNYIVSEKLYYNIKNIIELYKSNKQNINIERGGFELTIYARGSKSLIYYLDRGKSLQLFDKIIEVLSWKNENEYRLLLQLQILKKRIKI